MFLSLAINPPVFWDLLTWPCSQSHQIPAPLNLFLIKHQLWHWPVYTLAYRSHLKGRTRDSLKDICQQTLEFPSLRGRVGITSHTSKVHGVGKKAKTEAIQLLLLHYRVPAYSAMGRGGSTGNTSRFLSNRASRVRHRAAVVARVNIDCLISVSTILNTKFVMWWQMPEHLLLSLPSREQWLCIFERRTVAGINIYIIWK